MPTPPWSRNRGLSAVIDRWRSDTSLADGLTLDQTVAPRFGSPEPLPESLPPTLRAGLSAHGINALWKHQTEALNAALAGQDFIVATPTASGKSLCFYLPVLAELTAETKACALFILPTKALARDQERALSALFHACKLPGLVAVIDGDTPPEARRAARDRARVLICTPELLHTALLPHHTTWTRFLSALRYVILDELHSYTGIFGAHLSNVLLRLRRITDFYGSKPLFLCGSATIANPTEHAARITHSTSLRLIDRSGAPAGPRTFITYNPPLVNPSLGMRASHLRATVRFAADLVRANVSTLVFATSRSAVETLLRYLRDTLVPEGFSENLLSAYRGGYLPSHRRQIEQRLREGTLRCVVTTSALELGVDIGDLDAVVCSGWPGSLSGLLQRFGRAGRRGAPSLGVLITAPTAIDQFIARTPQYILSTPIEQARVDPDNLSVVIQHLRCAVFELPLGADEPYGDNTVSDTHETLSWLADQKLVHLSNHRWHWIGKTYPAAQISLRSASWQDLSVIDADRNETLESIDPRSALLRAYPGAIYQHSGSTWRVDSLDPQSSRVLVRPSSDDYFTEPVTRTEVTVTEVFEQAITDPPANDSLYSTDFSLGELTVTTVVTGYRKLRFHTHEPLGHIPLALDPISIDTVGLWWIIPPNAISRLSSLEAQNSPGTDPEKSGRARCFEALNGVAHSLRAVASLALLCNTSDLGTALGTAPPSSLPARDGSRQGLPTLFVFDALAGGAGLSEGLYDRREELFSLAHQLVSACACSSGCPACTNPGGEDSLLSRKSLTLALFEAVAHRLGERC